MTPTVYECELCGSCRIGCTKSAGTLTCNVLCTLLPALAPADPTPDQVTRACEAYAAETGATWVSPRGMAAALKAGAR